MVDWWKKRGWTLAALAIIMPTGFATKFYTGPAAEWVSNSLGGVFYVVFWSILFFLAAPRVPPFILSAVVFVVTCLLEFLQLWHPVFLENIRKGFIGQALLGTTFSWLDFFHYSIGMIVSIGLITIIGKAESGKNQHSSDPT